MCVTILHSCPLALHVGESYVPLVWREPGFDEMKNAMNSSLEASELTRNMPIAIDMKHACNASFNSVFGQKVAPDVLILSGQELELLDQQQQQQDTAFGIIVEDDVGAAAPLNCPLLTKMKPEEFPKVIIVHGNFPSSPSSSFSIVPAPSPAAFLFSAGAVDWPDHHHHHHHHHHHNYNQYHNIIAIAIIIITTPSCRRAMRHQRVQRTPLPPRRRPRRRLGQRPGAVFHSKGGLLHCGPGIARFERVSRGW
jgi:hypothetical protein